MNHSSRFLAAFLIFMAVFYACSSDDDDHPTPPPSTNDAGSSGTSSSGSSGSSSSGTSGQQQQPAQDSGPPPIRCTEEELAANDKTDGGAFEITFSSLANPSQYGNRCVAVKVGASVTFAGSFVQHPLQAAGGDSPNPVPYTESGSTLTITMPNAGTFGFECAFHPKLMFGAIKVVP